MLAHAQRAPWQASPSGYSCSDEPGHHRRHCAKTNTASAHESRMFTHGRLRHPRALGPGLARRSGFPGGLLLMSVALLPSSCAGALAAAHSRTRLPLPVHSCCITTTSRPLHHKAAGPRVPTAAAAGPCSSRQLRSSKQRQSHVAHITPFDQAWGTQIDGQVNSAAGSQPHQPQMQQGQRQQQLCVLSYTTLQRKPV